MLSARKNFLAALLLLLGLSGIAAVQADAATAHDEAVSAQPASLAGFHSPPSGDEDCRLGAEEAGKRRQRDFDSTPRASTASASPPAVYWATVSSPGASPAPRPARACAPHPGSHASPWLQLKLQLGQAP